MQPPTLDGNRPQVIAHRGSSRARPEHTIGAYELALAEGADAVECDIRLTADRRLVCIHDRRIDRTSTGAGVVSELTLDELMAYDFGSWHGEPAPGVLTLESLLDLLERTPRRVDLAVETKHPTRFGGSVEVALARMLTERGLHTPDPARTNVRTMSFSVLAMRRARELMPRLDRVLLSEAGINPLVRSGGLPDRIQICGMSTSMLRRHPSVVARQHARRHPVHVYTVDEPADLERCLTLGVDGIITNRPRVVQDALSRVWDSR